MLNSGSPLTKLDKFMTTQNSVIIRYIKFVYAKSNVTILTNKYIILNTLFWFLTQFTIYV